MKTQATRNLILNSAATAGLLLIFFSAYSQIPRYNSNSASPYAVFLDFDGHVVKGTSWNWDSTIHARPAGLITSIITEVFNRVAEDYRIFNINITTDSTVYARAPVARRVRIILTPTYQWYGSAAGIAFVSSFTWGDGTPAWVFTSLLENNPKYIAEATSHEIGHTLGLQHQSTYNKTCDMITEYAEGRGAGEIGWAPIMGVGYYKNMTIWTVGTSVEGCNVTQNDISIISKLIGFRNDDHGNTRQTATNIIMNGKYFQMNGMINQAPDRDFFKITLASRLRLKGSIIPSNVGAANSGANVDIFMTLIKATGDTIGRYNPKMLLSASVDTVLPAGIYYLGVDGINNQNVSDYGSVGLYSLSGSLETTTTSAITTLVGQVKQNLHLINWNYGSTDPDTQTRIEYSSDGVHFISLQTLPASTTHYSYKPSTSGDLYYRVKMILPGDSTSYYSNTVALSNNANVSLVSNIIRNIAQIQVSGDYSYQVFDETGRLFQNGKLSQGMNNININQVHQGLLLLKVYNQSVQLQFKLIKQ